MNSLFRCNIAHGNSLVAAGPPRLATYRDALFVPGSWGLYDHGRRLITDSAYFRGPDADLIKASYRLDVWPRNAAVAADAPYYFVGQIHDHYGHFVVATFSRLWALARAGGPRVKLVTYAIPNAADKPFVEALLNTVGFSLADCVTFDEPTYLPSVTVAAPSFEETSYVHTEFAALCCHAGSVLLGTSTRAPSDQPIYLAKYRLETGVATVENEAVFASALERRGVRIVFPEQLSLAEQVGLLADHRVITGLMGSAFHTAAFVPPRRLLMLAYQAEVYTNQVLIDKVCGHDALYVFPRDRFQHSFRPGFNINWTLTEPEATAEDFLRMIDVVTRDLSADPADTLLRPPSAWANLGIGKVTRQSSTGLQSRGQTTDEDSRGGVSGFLTGSFQFHTDHESGAWWDIDLGAPCRVMEVRLFNRLDECSDRSALFSILVSDGGHDWVEAYARTNGTPFGGMEGEPFSWCPVEGVRTRFVRIKLNTCNFLHLDQVAVLGISD